MEFPRLFLLHRADGTVWQGAEFHTGLVFVYPDHPEDYQPWIALSVDALLADRKSTDPLYAARIEWADKRLKDLDD